MTAAERAETYLRLLAESELRRASTLPREPEPAPDDPASAWSCIGRLHHVAAALTAVDAIDGKTAQAVTEELKGALRVRGRFPVTRPTPTPDLLARRGRPAAGSASGRPDAIRVTPVGHTLKVDDGGAHAELSLTSLIRARTETLFTVEGPAQEPDRSSQARSPVDGLAATDDQGDPYSLCFRGGIIGGRVHGWLSVRPAPHARTRWLDVHSGPGTPRFRVDAGAAAARPAVGRVEPAGGGGPGERLLDTIAAHLLAQLPNRDGGQSQDLDEMVAALEATGMLPPGSPAAGRLATLCQWAGFGSGRGLAAALAAGRIPPAGLPGSWDSVLAYFRDGPHAAAATGMASLAVELPELGGARFFLAGLGGEPDRTMLRVVACGLPAQPWLGDTIGMGWFPWWIRDSTGQWHVSAFDDSGDGNAEFRILSLRLVPPLPPSVTELEIFVHHDGRRIRATVPVHWMDTDE